MEAGALGGTTLYAWEGGSVIAEYNGASNGMAWTKSYIYLGGRLLATEAPLSVSTTETKYQHPDRLGTRLVTSSTGAVVSENISLPFGATISGESVNLAGSATKKRFTSYDRSDTTKLDYAVNRHYSSAQGRFTQVDPIGMSATQLEDPQSLNLYAYVGNDPINYTDPDGLFSFKNLIAKGYKIFARIAVVLLVVAIVIGLSMAGPAGPGAFMIFKMALGAIKFAIDGWNNGNKFLQYVSAGIGAYLGFEVSGSFAKTNSTFGKASGAIIGAVSSFIEEKKYDPQYVKEKIQKLIDIITAPTDFTRIALEAIRKNNKSGLNDAVIACHAAIESGLTPIEAPFGRAGEIGMLQMKWGTAIAVAKESGEGKFSKTDLRNNPGLNVRLATRYLRTFLRGERGADNLRDALGSYKQGPSGMKGLTVASQQYADAVIGCADHFLNK